ncbi:MAG TPA: Hsp20/alpha crystallin family protein [Perlabentimonas sp.]|nr:Hsp20/alpha crystallin family protein [Bacteroidales bacterium]MDD4671908.1 Hsp20/alpha crystallin family protein [Bacteroidales bacterium]MDY0348686.1 Hsp20/alpha crystallin family protein [Tenuifilaceae bacterium]HZJ73449.1 Hsp20/alpha crystallin family protein [Perlabentimonas sp.]
MLRARRGIVPSFVENFFGEDFLSNFFDSSSSGTVPAVNIIENKNEFVIEFAAPGLEKKDFNVDFHNNVLSISCQKEQKNEEKDEEIMHREFSYTAFRRSFTLPEGTDADKVKASYKDGVLTVKVPKRDEAKQKPVRKIAIS